MRPFGRFLRRERVPDLIGVLAVTTVTVAPFAFLGPLGAATIGVIGLNLTTNIINGGCSKLKEQWLSSIHGALNHDIQEALARAFKKALANLMRRYFDLPQARKLPRKKKRYIRRLFRRLEKQAQAEFSATLRQATQEQAIKDYLYEAEEETVKGKLWHQIEQTNVLPAGYEDFKKFLRENLFLELQFWFGEELKADNRESNKAWRAFQRLLLEGMQAEVQAVRESQAVIQQDLQKLAPLEGQLEQLRDVIERRSTNEPFQQGLERAVDQIDQVRKRMDEMHQTLQRVDQTTQRTEQKMDDANTKLDLLVERQGTRVEHHRFANTAPPMPPNFVPRREELNELRKAVIGDRDTGPVALTGLRGMGGIGKTALAIALCHDDGMQEIFPDGVVWVEVGREPGNLTGKMRRVGRALGDGPDHYDSPEAGTDRLRTLLKDKAVLLVLDDVWDARHVEPFIVEAPRCRVLFTTRSAGITLGLDAREIPLGVLAPEQAISLLREWTGRGEPVFPEIAERLGYLPLALKLAGARLRGDMSGAEWLEAFQRVSQMKLSRRSTDPQENLLVSFELSVRELPAKGRCLYYTLGIFPEDVRIPESVVMRLWRLSPELSQFDCDELVTELAQLALIERNADDKTVTLHDLLREYTREQLGDELATTHAALLSAYNPDEKPWPQIEHDGYLYHHLAYHLREAGRTEELYKLLTGSPDWMEAKFVACTGDTAYVTDLNLAISDFADPLAAAEVLRVVKLHTARQVVNARVSSYSNTDLRTLVWLGREDEALAHARLRGKQKGRFGERGKGKVDGLSTVYYALRKMGRPNLSLLHEVREVAHSIGDDHDRGDALSSVAKALAQARRYDEAREVARSIGYDLFRGHALSSVAKALAEAGRYEEAREVARSIGDDEYRADVLMFVAAALARAGDDRRADELFGEAREVARSIEGYGDRADALSSVAAALARAGDDHQADELFGEAREVARSIGYDGRRGFALQDLVFALAEAGRYEEAREVACSIGDDDRRGFALMSVATALAQARRYNEAREVARSIGYDRVRGYALSSVAKALAEAGRYEEAREVARSIGIDELRAKALRGLASALAEAERFNYALAILDLHELDVFLQALAEWALPFELVESALSISVLREATGIAGWVHSDWREIHEFLNS